MSGVVLRCSNCGTVQDAPGECDACHDGQVRYFCTNHAPGLWLDSSACPRCGARHGERAPAPEPTRSAPETAMPPRTSRRPRRMEDPGFETRPWGEAPGTSTGRPEDPVDYRVGGTNPLLEILASAARASMGRRTGTRRMDRTPVRTGGGGCLGRLFMLLLLLLALFVILPLLLGGTLLGLF